MEPGDRKISVWICQEEKLISGLSRRTTCSDVVRVLLEDSGHGRRRRHHQYQHQQHQGQPAPLAEGGGGGGGGGGMLSGPPHSYCIVEKWRGFERILPNKTKILRLWAAWGDEQENVRFVLVRSEASLPNAGPRSAEARVVPSKESPCHDGSGAAAAAATAAARASLALLSQERQRRVVRKAFRKLAKLNKRKGAAPLTHQEAPSAGGRGRAEGEDAEGDGDGEGEEEGASAAERMETLVHLVLSQDHTIRQQLKRLRELDRDIERFEAKTHLDRVKRHGVNYVQDTYLDGGGSGGGDAEPAEEGHAWAEYGRRCEQVLLLQERRRRQEELLERLAGEIQQELNERWMRRRREELAAAGGSGAGLSSEADCDTTELAGGHGDGDGELHVERERVKTQLSASLYIGLRLSTDLDAVKAELEAARRARHDKETELRRLLDDLRAFDVEGDEEEEEEDAPPPLPPPQFPDGDGPLPEPSPLTSGGWGEPAARGLGKDCEENDEDSDTGLSSMHSQDSDSVPPVCESLV